jgi:hypothetical protein
MNAKGCVGSLTFHHDAVVEMFAHRCRVVSRQRKLRFFPIGSQFRGPIGTFLPGGIGRPGRLSFPMPPALTIPAVYQTPEYVELLYRVNKAVKDRRLMIDFTGDNVSETLLLEVLRASVRNQLEQGVPCSFLNRDVAPPEGVIQSLEVSATGLRTPQGESYVDSHGNVTLLFLTESGLQTILAHVTRR